MYKENIGLKPPPGEKVAIVYTSEGSIPVKQTFSNHQSENASANSSEPATEYDVDETGVKVRMSTTTDAVSMPEYKSDPVKEHGANAADKVSPMSITPQCIICQNPADQNILNCHSCKKNVHYHCSALP